MPRSFSSKAWLCDKERSFQNKGIEGTLSFDGSTISFVPGDSSKSINISQENLALADLNNIKGLSQIVFTTKDNSSYIFVFYEPVNTSRTLSTMLLRPVSSYFVYRDMSQTLAATKQWKETLVQSLPSSKIQTRKEARVVFILVWSVILVLVIVGGLAAFVYFFAAR